MSNVKPVFELIEGQKEKFLLANKENGNPVSFVNECMFAKQQISKSSYILGVAQSNQASLQAAILNVANIGISLNPASSHAYLVPRDGKICLDISFRGLVKLSTDSGAIKLAKVELVYEKDTFEWCGPLQIPIHKADPFGERGDIKGGYCIATLPDGSIITEVMSIDEIYKIRDTSKAFKKNGGPWIDWPLEMCKKTILKRAYKSWPQTPNRKRLDIADEAINEAEGTAYTIEQHVEFMAALTNSEPLAFYEMRLKTPENVWIALHNSFEKGEKTKNKEAARLLEKAGIEMIGSYVVELDTCADNQDLNGFCELWDELNEPIKNVVKTRVSPASTEIIRAQSEAV